MRPHGGSLGRRGGAALAAAAVAVPLIVALTASLIVTSVGLDALAAEEVDAAQRPVVVFFYQDGCPDCERIAEVLDALGADLPPGAIVRHEIGDSASRRLFYKLQKAYGIDVSTVPLVFIGDRALAGASRIQELALTDALGDCVTGACSSPLDRVPPDVFPWIDLAQLGLLLGLVVLLALLQRP